jgi:sugar phosphate isomerase/epimerase
MNPQVITRRHFVAQASAAAVVLGTMPSALGAETPRTKIITFTKPFRSLGAKETAALVAEVGWDGVELPVRASGGQFTPDQAPEQLPKFVEAFREARREIVMLTTDITEANASTEKLLRLMKQLGIRQYRLGNFSYPKDKPVAQQLEEVRVKLRDLASLNQEIGVQAVLQNHSGENRVGAAIWDTWMLIKDLPPAAIGYCFDIGHATIEGGMAWPTNFRLAQPRLASVYVKDFRWERTDKGWRARWCPLGEGMIERRFFALLEAARYSGSISQHHEYELGGRDEMVKWFKKDLARLREWLA